MTTARELLKNANIGDEFEIDGEENAKVIRASDVTAEDCKCYINAKKTDVIVNDKALRYIRNKTVAYAGVDKEAKIIKRAERPVIVNGVAYI